MSNRKHILYLIVALCIVALGAGRAVAQEETPPAPESLDIGVYVSPPFVDEKGENAYSGMAIELWEGSRGGWT